MKHSFRLRTTDELAELQRCCPKWSSPGLTLSRLNFAVARGCPGLEQMEIASNASLLDSWADDVRRSLPGAEEQFHREPAVWKNDLPFFRLGVLCWYVDEILGVRYRDDLRESAWVVYTDPGDLFLHGLIATRRGTCATMPALHCALGWRLGWPVSLALAGWHVFCRFDDGTRTRNIESTRTGGGGFTRTLIFIT